MYYSDYWFGRRFYNQSEASMPCDAADLPSFGPPTNVSYRHTVLLCNDALPALMVTTGSAGPFPLPACEYGATDAVAVRQSQ